MPSTAKETVYVDPDTGGRKGQKVARFDLVPWRAMWWVAEHYGKGASKYTKYGECTCATAAQGSMQKVSVGVTTSEHSDSEIQGTPNGNERTASVGARSTPNEQQNQAGSPSNDAGNVTLPINGGEQPAVTDSLSPATRLWSHNHADCVAKQNKLATQTTTTQVESSVGLSATDAISELASSKSEEPSGRSPHLSGCPALNVVELGDRNWERGYPWSLSIAALHRHLAAFCMGEDIDPETESPHLAAVVFHALALMTFSETHPELDNRTTNA